jgi:hypothetical protein
MNSVESVPAEAAPIAAGEGWTSGDEEDDGDGVGSVEPVRDGAVGSGVAADSSSLAGDASLPESSAGSSNWAERGASSPVDGSPPEVELPSHPPSDQVRSTWFNPATAARLVGGAGQLLATATTDGEGDDDGDCEGDGLGDFDGLGELEGVAVGVGEGEPDGVADGDAVTGSDGDGSADSGSEDADELGGDAAGDSSGDCASELLVDSAEMTPARAAGASTEGDASTARSSELSEEEESSRALDDADGLAEVVVGDGDVIDEGLGELVIDGDGDALVEGEVDAVGEGCALIDASHSGGNPSVDNATFVDSVDAVVASVTESAAFAGGAPSKEIETAKQAITEAPMRMRALASNRPKAPARTRRPIA